MRYISQINLLSIKFITNDTHDIFYTYVCTALHCFCAFIYIVYIYLQLDLFNDDTRPPEHISRPTQVNVSQSYFHSLNKLLKSDHIVQVSRLVLVNKLHHIR